jgi:predicted DCC family thiol-disulfide oxidoreductase YuxK
MTANTETEVIYNASCPICSREVDAYRRAAEAGGLPIGFHDITAPEAAAWGLTPEDAARRFHVVQDGHLLSGLDAFIALWARLPRLGWLARLAALPVIRPVAAFVYDRIAAPALYALHRRRVARRAA